MTFKEWLALVNPAFPNLCASNSRPTSPEDVAYNCIAWAADDDSRWWWPDSQWQNYWPAKAPRIETIEAFEQAYSGIGFRQRSDAVPENGIKKIAIYASAGNVPKHAARQLPDGWWASKLGPDIDIEHANLSALEGPTYGSVAVILAKSVSSE